MCVTLGRSWYTLFSGITCTDLKQLSLTSSFSCSNSNFHNSSCDFPCPSGNALGGSSDKLVCKETLDFYDYPYGLGQWSIETSNCKRGFLCLYHFCSNAKSWIKILLKKINQFYILTNYCYKWFYQKLEACILSVSQLLYMLWHWVAYKQLCEINQSFTLVFSTPFPRFTSEFHS